MQNGSHCVEVAHLGAEAGASEMGSDASSGDDGDAESVAPTQDAGTETDSETPNPWPEPEDASSGTIDAAARDANSVDGASPRPHDASAPDGNPPDAIMPWQPPAVSQVRMTGTSCLSVSPSEGGRCGGYYCGVTEAVLTPDIDPSKPCGSVPAYICSGELQTIATTCSGQAQEANVIQLALGNTEGFAATLETCLAASTQIVNAGVRETCRSCFAQAHICCAGDIECGMACLGAARSKTCGDAQKAAGCLDPLFACGGLPSPF